MARIRRSATASHKAEARATFGGRLESAAPVAKASTRVALLVGRRGAEPKRIADPLTNRAGYFRIRVKRGGASALRYRFTWPSPDGETFASREATAGRPIRYRERP